MRQFIRLVSRFRRDERGVFGIIFALLAIVLVAMSGAVVDFTTVQQARTKAQVALDSAALALQPSIYTSGITAATIQGQAQALLKDRLKDPVATQGWPVCATGSGAVYPCATVNSPTYDTTAGTLTLTATMIVPMNFVSLVGIQTMQVQLLSVATRQKLNLEVAMVLDNSGSMAYTMGQNAANGPPTRMDTLHSAADCAVNILFYNVTTCSASTTGITPNANTEIGLVPFTEAVNVNAATFPNQFLDRTGTGSASITPDNFDNDDFDNNGTTAAQVDTFAGPVDRVALFSSMKDSSGNAMSWGGCVEARISPYDTNATPPSAGTPATLFTPYFAPDEPDYAPSGGPYSNNYISDMGVGSNCPGVANVVWKQVKTKCSNAASGSNAATNFNKSCSGSGTTTNTYTQTTKSGTVTTVSSIPASIGGYAGPSTSDYDTYSTTGTGSNITNTRSSTYYYMTQREFQERLCKYNGATMTAAVAPSSVFGPNGDCPAAPLAALSTTPSAVINAVNAMQPIGGTNITEGAAWGFRELSPVDPFNAKPYNAATSKVLIIMTDGANTIYPGTNMNDDTFYSAYGYPWNGRLLNPSTYTTAQLQDAPTLETEMNNRLTTVCNNAKAAGITVYTIGIDVKDSVAPTSNTQAAIAAATAASAANATLLSNCATSAADAYTPNTATELQNAFISIAGQLAALRLAK